MSKRLKKNMIISNHQQYLMHHMREGGHIKLKITGCDCESVDLSLEKAIEIIESYHNYRFDDIKKKFVMWDDDQDESDEVIYVRM